MEFDLLDLTNYQHPPFMFFLWYSFLVLDWAGGCLEKLIESRSQSRLDPAKKDPEPPKEAEQKAPEEEPQPVEPTPELEASFPPEDSDKIE